MLYITTQPIIAISEIPSCENDGQFIIHCRKRQRRPPLIEFVLCLVAGCLRRRVGVGLPSATPMRGGSKVEVYEEGPLTPPPLSSASVSPNNQLVSLVKVEQRRAAFRFRGTKSKRLGAEAARLGACRPSPENFSCWCLKATHTHTHTPCTAPSQLHSTG